MAICDERQYTIGDSTSGSTAACAELRERERARGRTPNTSLRIVSTRFSSAGSGAMVVEEEAVGVVGSGERMSLSLLTVVTEARRRQRQFSEM